MAKCDFCDATATHNPRDPMYAKACGEHLDNADKVDTSWLEAFSRINLEAKVLQYRQARISKTNAVWRDLQDAAVVRAVLEGVMLVVDPSIGSTTSAPGYALYSAGVCIESGTIDTGGGHDTHRRLFELGRSFREEFASHSIDVLVVEDVPSKRWGAPGRGGWRHGSIKQQVQLHRAVGAVHASVQATHALAVHPVTWHCVAPAGYEKTDEGDALCMGELVLQYARVLAARHIRAAAPNSSRSKSKSRSGPKSGSESKSVKIAKQGEWEWK